MEKFTPPPQQTVAEFREKVRLAIQLLRSLKPQTTRGHYNAPDQGHTAKMHLLQNDGPGLSVIIDVDKHKDECRAGG